MTPERWERIKALFDAALERRVEERLAFLAEACHDDWELQSEVETLLIENDRIATSFLLQDPASADRAATVSDVSDVKCLGDYRILKLLGSGGMGSVYQAYEQSMHRMVALKVLNSTLIATGEATRFEREAWIAGRLRHPNIVKAYGQGIACGVQVIARQVDG
jgi:eukaryotic-like serine/threonine-protein kinase